MSNAPSNTPFNMSNTSNVSFDEFTNDRIDLGLTMSEFTRTFEDHVGFTDVATTIVRLLMTGIDVPFTDPSNPAHTYGCESSSDSIMEQLRSDVASNLSDTAHKNLIPAFFHSGGVYNKMTNTIMDEYWNYIDLIAV